MALQFGTSTALTITAGSLASATARSSAAVTVGTTQNTFNINLTVNVLTTATAATGNKQILIYAYASEDGTNYSGNSSTADDVDGTDKSMTVGVPTNLKFVGSIQLNQGAVAVTAHGEFELTQVIGLPAKWGIVLYNDSGVALGATVSASYREVYYS